MTGDLDERETVPVALPPTPPLLVPLVVVVLVLVVFQIRPVRIDLEEVQPVLSGAFKRAGDTEGSNMDLKECAGGKDEIDGEDEELKVGEQLRELPVCEIGDGEADSIIINACEVGPFGVGGTG